MTDLTASDIAAKRIREARRRKEWRIADLAAACEKAGVPQITSAVITNLETRRRPGREITAEELLALAWVLEVPPVLLLTPLGDDEELEVVPGVSLGPFEAPPWMADDYPQAQLAIMTAEGEVTRHRSLLAVVRNLVSVIWRIRAAGKILDDEGLLASSRTPAAEHEDAVRESARRARTNLDYLSAVGHDVTLPADVAAMIARYDMPAIADDDRQED